MLLLASAGTSKAGQLKLYLQGRRMNMHVIVIPFETAYLLNSTKPPKEYTTDDAASHYLSPPNMILSL